MTLFSKSNDGILRVDTSPVFTLGTVGKAANAIDYSKNIDDIRSEEIALLSDYLKIEKKNIIMINQVHGDSIIMINTPVSDNRRFIDADGMITNAEKLCIVIRTADCVPVFAFDDKKKALGAVHSGWRGCRLNITGQLIRKMKSSFKSEYNDLHIYILPSIGPESYTVNVDVASYFGNDIITKNDKIYCNLWTHIENSLTGEGIPKSNIHQSEICTYQNNADYYSYRLGDSGRNLNFGYINNI